MRDIIYRAKRKDNGEWVYGVPLKEGYSQEIEMLWYEYGSLAYTERVQVLPETVGQYTGLTDKNGKKVFEGDIVAYKYGNNKVGYVKVEYDCVFGLFFPFGDSDSALETKEVEVVGNVFDNAELLEVK